MQSHGMLFKSNLEKFPFLPSPPVTSCSSPEVLPSSLKKKKKKIRFLLPLSMHSTPFPIPAQLPGSFEPPPLGAPDSVPPLVCHASPLKALPSVPRSPCLPSSVTHKLGQDAASEIRSHPPGAREGPGFLHTLVAS